MNESDWSVANVVCVFGVVALVISLVLILYVVTRRNCEVESDRANITRASLLIWLTIALFVFLLALQRYSLQAAVSQLM